MGRAWRLGPDGNVCAAVGHSLGTARAGQAESRNAILQIGAFPILDHPARMQRAQDVLALPDKFRTPSLTAHTDFPDYTGHRVPGGHAPLSLVLAEWNCPTIRVNLACINAQNGELHTPRIADKTSSQIKMTGGHKNS
jgi:hypothetical protein